MAGEPREGASRSRAVHFTTQWTGIPHGSPTITEIQEMQPLFSSHMYEGIQTTTSAILVKYCGDRNSRFLNKRNDHECTKVNTINPYPFHVETNQRKKGRCTTGNGNSPTLTLQQELQKCALAIRSSRTHYSLFSHLVLFSEFTSSQPL